VRWTPRIARLFEDLLARKDNNMTELMHRNYQTSAIDQVCTSCEAYKQQYGTLPARIALSADWQEEMQQATSQEVDGQEVAIEYRDQYKYDVIVIVEQAQQA
jgi:hypothetical protein